MPTSNEYDLWNDERVASIDIVRNLEYNKLVIYRASAVGYTFCK
jgi:hypothetical protein